MSDEKQKDQALTETDDRLEKREKERGKKILNHPFGTCMMFVMSRSAFKGKQMVDDSLPARLPQTRTKKDADLSWFRKQADRGGIHREQVNPLWKLTD